MRTYPDGDTNASLNIHARANDSGIGISIGLELLLGSRSVHANVQLSVSDVDAQVSEALEDGSQLGSRGGRGVLGRSALAGHVSLQTDAVDAKTVGLDESGDALGTLGLGVAVLEVVVVVVELGGGVCCQGHAEGDGDVGLTDDAEEDAVTVSSILVESLKAG